MMRLTDKELLACAMSSNIFAQEKDDKVAIELVYGDHYVAYVPDNYEKTYRDAGTGVKGLKHVLRYMNAHGSYNQRQKAHECWQRIITKMNAKAEW